MSSVLDLASLEIFCAVAAEHSVTKAARRLERVQSNVTTRVQQLEEELDTALFLRDGKRMTLTPDGERLLAYAEQLLSLSEEARQAMRPQRPSGRLRIGAMESTAATLLPQLFAQYHCRWPEVDLAISTGTTAALIDAVLARTLDCALVADPAATACDRADAQPLDAQLYGVPVFSEQLMLVLPGDHPVVHSPQDLQITTLAGFARGCAYRQIGENWLSTVGKNDARQVKVLEVGSYHAILACVAAGSCIAVMPRSVLDLQRAGPDFTTCELMSVDTLLVSRKSYAPAAFEAFARMLPPATMQTAGAR
jgi:DNA-binding transcriptional LysR family regulator